MENPQLILLIIGITLGAIIIILFMTTLICYLMAIYNKNKQDKTDEITLPNFKMYQLFKEDIIHDIKAARSMEYQEFTIKSFDNLTLYARYFESFKGAPIELMFHGYRGSSERDLSTGIRRAKLCGRNAFIVDQRAHGKSEGHTISFGINERRDCLEWIKFVINHFGPDVKIVLTGISMGAATVMMTSNMDLPNNVIGILADCGYDSPKNIIKKYIADMKLPAKLFYPFVKLGAKIFGKFNLEEASAIEAVKNSKVPIILIHGTSDSLVPHQHSVNCYEACTSTKKLVSIKDAEHGVSYLHDPDTYVNELNAFIKN
jgi:alpha-beta hydrolase superfamily lysophospholipase